VGTPPQQSAQSVSDQQIGECDKQCRRQQRRAQIDLVAGRKVLALRFRRQPIDRLHLMDPGRKVEGTPGVGGAVKPWWMARRGYCGRYLGGGDRPGGGRRPLQSAKPVEGFDRCQSLLARLRHPLAHRLDPPQHLDEKTRQSEVRPVGVRCRVDENDPASSAPLRRNERGTVNQPRPCLAGKVQIRLGQDLARYRDVGRDGEPGEWTFRRKRS
jgi:hypothetical protein